MSLPTVLEAQAQNGEGDPASPVSRQSLDRSALRRASLAACLGGDAAELSPAGWTPPSRNPLASSWTPESRVSTPESTSQVSVLLRYFRISGWIPRGVDSQKNRSDASDMPRCAPPYTVLARRDPFNINGLDVSQNRPETVFSNNRLPFSTLQTRLNRLGSLRVRFGTM